MPTDDELHATLQKILQEKGLTTNARVEIVTPDRLSNEIIGRVQHYRGTEVFETPMPEVYEVSWEILDGRDAGAWMWVRTLRLSFQGACRLGLERAKPGHMKLVGIERILSALLVATALGLSACSTSQGHWAGGPDPEGTRRVCHYEAIRANPISAAPTGNFVADGIAIGYARGETEQACMEAQGYYIERADR